VQASVSAGKRAIERVKSIGKEGISQDEAQELLYELFDSSFATGGDGLGGLGTAEDVINIDRLFISARLPDGPSLAADVSGAPAGGLLAVGVSLSPGGCQTGYICDKTSTYGLPLTPRWCQIAYECMDLLHGWLLDVTIECSFGGQNNVCEN
jgi:hypothetical protein